MATDFCSYFWGRINRKSQLGLFPIFSWHFLHEKWCKSRPSASSVRMKHKKALQPVAFLANFLYPFHRSFNLLLANCVMSSGIVIGCILFTSNQLLGAEQLFIGSSSDFIWKQYENICLLITSYNILFPF